MNKSVLIEALGLLPHPEGGYFREIYRSGAEPMRSRGATDRAGTLMHTGREPPERNVMTSIYWMLDRQFPLGYWCNNASDHVHYFHAGEALTYFVLSPGGRLERHVLGPRLDQGHVLQLVVEGGCWKAVHLEQGEYGLIGEAVAPGFDFHDFRWGTREELTREFPRAFEAHPELLRFFKPEARRDFDAYYEPPPAGGGRARE
jgi:predicted cupin superfamily sugar epimerase